MKLEDTSATQYGELAALKVHHGIHFAEALRLRGATLREYTPYEERWIARLVAAAVANDRETMGAFADAYALERERLKVAAPVLPPEPATISGDPDTTQAPFLRAQPVLPFRDDLPRVDRVLSRNPPPVLAEPSPRRVDDLDGTMMIRSPLAEVRLPGFGGTLTPTLVPEMSLDAYALLQAELRTGAKPAEVLRRSGVASEGALDVLRQHFFSLFQRDPNAQSEFQERFRVHLARLSTGAR